MGRIQSKWFTLFGVMLFCLWKLQQLSFSVIVIENSINLIFGDITERRSPTFSDCHYEKR